MAEAEPAVEHKAPELRATADSALPSPLQDTMSSLISGAIDSPSSPPQPPPPLAQPLPPTSGVADDPDESRRGAKRPREDGQDRDPHAEDRLVKSISHDDLHSSAQNERSPSAKRTCVDGPADAAKLEGNDASMEEPAQVEEQVRSWPPVEGRTGADDKDEALDQEGPEEKELRDDNQKHIDAGVEDQSGSSHKDEEEPKEVKLGPRIYTSSVDMFNFFYELLHGWPLNVTINKYEHMMLMDLISKGHQDPPSKIGVGIKAFQVKVNPEYYSRCFYLIRNDGSTDNFSYRKCVDKVLPLPANMACLSGSLGTDQSWAKGKSGQKVAGNYRGHGVPAGGKRSRGNSKRRGDRFGGRGVFGKGSSGHGHLRDH